MAQGSTLIKALLPERNNPPVLLWRLRFAAQVEGFHKHVEGVKSFSIYFNGHTSEGVCCPDSSWLKFKDQMQMSLRKLCNQQNTHSRLLKETDPGVIGSGVGVQQRGQLSKL